MNRGDEPTMPSSPGNSSSSGSSTAGQLKAGADGPERPSTAAAAVVTSEQLAFATSANPPAACQEKSGRCCLCDKPLASTPRTVTSTSSHAAASSSLSQVTSPTPSPSLSLSLSPSPSPVPLTPLRLATQCGDAQAVRLLLAAGADPNERGGDKRTLLHCAAFAGFGEVTSALLAAGADPNAPDGVGRTPLHSASFAGHVAVAKALIAAGAVIDAWSFRPRSGEEDSEDSRQPSPSRSDSARDDQLAASLAAASLRDRETNPRPEVSSSPVPKTWWKRKSDAKGTKRLTEKNKRKLTEC